MRGDHRIPRLRGDLQRGPPPHARGPPGRGAGVKLLTGTTPACAGTTVAPAAASAGGRDHPRMRGDHVDHQVSLAEQRGPPPHARGPPWPPYWLGSQMGTTPACAGTTGVPRRGPQIERDHPRMRGDHCLMPRTTLRRPGPPPHARGPPDGSVDQGPPTGTTPACAGTTRRTALARSNCGDHPRMRGDHVAKEAAAENPVGPPPHARGPRAAGHRPRGHRGTTPACAGTTPVAITPRSLSRDHPRMRGDHRP